MKCLHMHDHRIVRYRNAEADRLVRDKLAVYFPKSTYRQANAQSSPTIEAPEHASESTGVAAVPPAPRPGQTKKAARASGAERRDGGPRQAD